MKKNKKKELEKKYRKIGKSFYGAALIAGSLVAVAISSDVNVQAAGSETTVSTNSVKNDSTSSLQAAALDAVSHTVTVTIQPTFPADAGQAAQEYSLNVKNGTPSATVPGATARVVNGVLRMLSTDGNPLKVTITPDKSGKPVEVSGTYDLSHMVAGTKFNTIESIGDLHPVVIPVTDVSGTKSVDTTETAKNTATGSSKASTTTNVSGTKSVDTTETAENATTGSSKVSTTTNVSGTKSVDTTETAENATTGSNKASTTNNDNTFEIVSSKLDTKTNEATLTLTPIFSPKVMTNFYAQQFKATITNGTFVNSSQGKIGADGTTLSMITGGKEPTNVTVKAIDPSKPVTINVDYAASGIADDYSEVNSKGTISKIIEPIDTTAETGTSTTETGTSTTETGTSTTGTGASTTETGTSTTGTSTTGTGTSTTGTGTSTTGTGTSTTGTGASTTETGTSTTGTGTSTTGTGTSTTGTGTSATETGASTKGTETETGTSTTETTKRTSEKTGTTAADSSGNKAITNAKDTEKTTPSVKTNEQASKNSKIASVNGNNSISKNTKATVKDSGNDGNKKEDKVSVSKQASTNGQSTYPKTGEKSTITMSILGVMLVAIAGLAGISLKRGKHAKK